MFHADDPCISLFVDMPENIGIIDLPGRGFLAAWIVSHLEICDLFPGEVHVRYQVAFLDLLVVQIVKDLAVGTSNGIADLVCLRYG